jgi:hypothetical protein
VVCSEKYHTTKNKDGAVLPPSPNEYRIIHASTGKVEVLWIPHMQNFKTPAGYGTSSTHITVFRQDL